ncbi:MAG: type II toxin-antitoxin system Phd/YefM family antitoxin [Verrucomicrobia bacterium]|nr:type II toxin-antitoxin system Phd/YefM family antitoxin [Verrucomicrobiota bacterium]
MTTVNVQEAAASFPKLLAAVEEKGETVVICRDGKPVAQMQAAKPKQRSRLEGDPSLRVTLAPGYDPIEPLREDEIPPEYR